jgi:hypothetical protein
MSWNELDILRARRAIFDAAQGMLAGNLSYIEGARKIVGAIEPSKLGWSEPDLMPFIGIDSETEALPFGEMRAHWQATALEALQPEIAKMEAWVRRFGEPHCRNLIEQFSNGEIESNS